MLTVYVPLAVEKLRAAFPPVLGPDRMSIFALSLLSPSSPDYLQSFWPITPAVKPASAVVSGEKPHLSRFELLPAIERDDCPVPVCESGKHCSRAVIIKAESGPDP
jgi:hypothetical protein